MKCTYLIPLLHQVVHDGLDVGQVPTHGAVGVLERAGEGGPARLRDVVHVGAGLLAHLDGLEAVSPRCRMYWGIALQHKMSTEWLQKVTQEME